MSAQRTRGTLALANLSSLRATLLAPTNSRFGQASAVRCPLSAGRACECSETNSEIAGINTRPVRMQSNSMRPIDLDARLPQFHRPNGKSPVTVQLGRGFARHKSLTMSYFHTGIRTIIGAEAFHCPVRDGKEWDHLAMVIRHNFLSS